MYIFFYILFKIRLKRLDFFKNNKGFLVIGSMYGIEVMRNLVNISISSTG